VSQSEFVHSSRRPRDGSWVPFRADDFAGGADDTRSDQGDVSDPGAEVENALSWADTRFPKEALGVCDQPCRLTNKALMLCFVAAEGIRICVAARRHLAQKLPYFTQH
jgi:hypothetical protein